MIRPGRLIPALALSLALVGCRSEGGSAPAAAGDVPPGLAALVPKAGEIPDWTPTGGAQHFQGEDLFIYINGGAEIYQEYGFRQVIAQDFVGPGGRTAALEIFEMSDSGAAFGMFTFKSSGKGRPAGIGQDSELEDYYLNFWKGRYLVTVTGSEESPEALAGVLDIGRAAGDKIAETGLRPDWASLLPPEWAGPRLKYLRGALGLFNIHPFFPRDVFKFREAAVGGDGAARVFILRYANPAEAGERMAAVRAAFAKSPAYRELRFDSPDAFEAETTNGLRIRVETFSDAIFLVLGGTSDSPGREFFDGLKKRRAALAF